MAAEQKLQGIFFSAFRDFADRGLGAFEGVLHRKEYPITRLLFQELQFT